MIHHKKSPFNMNYTPLCELAEAFETRIAHVDHRQTAEFYLEDVSDFQEVLDGIAKEPGGNELIQLENRFNELFEDLLGILDPILNLCFNDPQLVVIHHDITEEEALCYMPDYKAAYNLLPTELRPRPDYMNICCGETFGNVWPYEDQSLLLEWLQDPSCLEHMQYFNCTDLCVDLIVTWQKIERMLENTMLRELLGKLRETRAKLHDIYLFIHMELYPDIPYHTKSKVVDPQDFVLEPLYAEYCCDVFAQFSCNELSHTAFLSLLQSIEKGGTIGSMAPMLIARYDAGITHYRDMLATFSTQEWWKEYEEREVIFFTNFEQTLLAIQLAAGTFDNLDDTRYEAFQNSDRHLAALELWESLPTFIFSSLYMPDRGRSLDLEVWQVMKKEFHTFQHEHELDLVGGWEYYNRALEADQANSTLLREQAEELLPMHRDLRDCRMMLMTIANLSEVISKNNAR